MPDYVVMRILWALEDAIAQNPLSKEERDALIRAVTEAITKK